MGVLTIPLISELRTQMQEDHEVEAILNLTEVWR